MDPMKILSLIAIPAAVVVLGFRITRLILNKDKKTITG